jgi:transcriptional regulator with XRE-family HTH domain
VDDKELGRFIRSRREALSPTDVGLAVGARRRTPGLRRSEVATLAGISVDYLIRLEQGRDRRPSASVLAALADALRLSEDDRDHLRTMAMITHTVELCPSDVSPARVVRPNVQAMLDRLEPAPAFVLNRMADLLAWTSGYDALVRPIGVLDRTPANLLDFTFCDPRSRTAYPDWDAVADEQAGNLRVGCRPGDPEADQLIARLTAGGGAAFTERWTARPVSHKRTGTKRIVHPEVGELRVAFETMQLPDPDDQRLVVYLPADDATAAAFDRLAGRRPGALRAVNG